MPRQEVDGVDEETERRRELAAVVLAGLDPTIAWPAYFGRRRCSEFELSAYLYGALALPEADYHISVGPVSEGTDEGSGPLITTESSAGSVGPSVDDGQQVAQEDILAALGAAGRSLLSPERAETERLQSLYETGLLGPGAEEIYDQVVVAAKEYFGVSTASMSLIAEDAQFLKSAVGSLREETPREIALCARTVEANSMLVINDTHADDRFAANPLVVGEPFIRFYAGYPLHGPRGWNIGSLCIIDQEPRAFPDAEQKVLRAMAAVVQNRIDTGS
jgi:GAF domain